MANIKETPPITDNDFEKSRILDLAKKISAYTADLNRKGDKEAYSRITDAIVAKKRELRAKYMEVDGFGDTAIDRCELYHALLIGSGHIKEGSFFDFPGNELSLFVKDKAEELGLE